MRPVVGAHVFGRGEPAVDPTPPQSQYRRLGALAREAGFRNVQIISPGIADEELDWKSLAGDFARSLPGVPGHCESPVGDDQVTLYPVDTPLSRVASVNADCVIHIIPPVNELSSDAMQEIPQKMQLYLPHLDLKRKHRVLVVFHFSKPGNLSFFLEPVAGNQVCRDMLGFLDAIWIPRSTE